MEVFNVNSTMELTVLDESFTIEGDLDEYTSFLWVDKYRECGNFELYREVSTEVLELLKVDMYIKNADSPHFMIVEDIQTQDDGEEDIFKVTGRSGESILDRRVLRGQRTLSGNIQAITESLINEFFITPSNPEMTVSNMVFAYSEDEYITNLTIDGQYKGSLYDVISSICSEKEIGFRIYINASNEFEFKYYKGIDRSGAVVTIPKVDFSEEQDNFTNSKYLEANSLFKNVAIVGGEGEGASQIIAETGSGIGLKRREVFIEANDISSDGASGTISPSEYLNLLIQRGNESLSELKNIVSFDGEANTIEPFEYSVDFNVGDLVEITDKWGHIAKTRISEIIMSEDATGYKAYPTLESVAQEGE